MANEAAYVLVTPYTIRKSRTGGILARYTSRTDLQLVGARMFGPSKPLVDAFADLVRDGAREPSDTRHLLADYIAQNFSPDTADGRRHRVLMFIFEGENAVEKIWQVTGGARYPSGQGLTTRETYGDYIAKPDGTVVFFEPAVFVAPDREHCEKALRLWASYSKTDGGIIRSATDIGLGKGVEKTLVLLKPDNFTRPNRRAGSIIDVLSSTGLRIVGAKHFSMTVAQAEEFYGVVRPSLAAKFPAIGAERARNALRKEFGFDVPIDVARDLCAKLGALFAECQFEQIVQFMTGHRPSDCSPEHKLTYGHESSLALVYEGPDALRKIRESLGATDPKDAKPGSVRSEFGSNIMVNAAHASDSPENVVRELKIIDIEADTLQSIVDRHYTASPQRPEQQ